MKKSQIGVELFLVLSVLAAFIVILYGTASQEISKTKALNDAIISKGAVDSLAQMIDFAFLSGSGTVLSKELLVSQNSNCFYHTDLPLNKIYCTVSSEQLVELVGAGKERVFSQNLTAPSNAVKLGVVGEMCAPLTGGWVNVKVANEGGSVVVSCV
ncbi:MAG: hypothetical protein V1717_01630 [Candidatus Micrarchaeota archaeon]